MGKFCVIGLTVNNNIGRAWSGDVAVSTEHARRLMAQSDKIDKLYVVQVIKVVERPMPQVAVRDFDPSIDE